MNKRWLIVATVLILGALAVLPAGTARTAASPLWVKIAKERLSILDVKPPDVTKYERPKFGPTWFDVDLNGCSTRNDILARDLRDVVFKEGDRCFVVKGTLRDPYTGTTIDFVQGATSSAVQIDHVVALKAAWRTGAQAWTAARRLFYANDDLVLLAVDGPANNAKSDKDAAAWLPPNAGFHCRFVARQIAVKTKYDLWVTEPERTAMSDVLVGC